MIAKLEPGGAQLSLLRVVAELRGHGIASALHCGCATAAGIELARRHGAEPEVWGEGGNLQWVPEPRFAAWLGSGTRCAAGATRLPRPPPSVTGKPSTSVPITGTPWASPVIAVGENASSRAEGRSRWSASSS